MLVRFLGQVFVPGRRMIWKRCYLKCLLMILVFGKEIIFNFETIDTVRTHIFTISYNFKMNKKKFKLKLIFVIKIASLLNMLIDLNFTLPFKG